MAYSITTKDGITINNIPDNVAKDDPSLKARVAQIRAGRIDPETNAPINKDIPTETVLGQQQSSIPDYSLGEKLIGAGETALSTLTGIPASVVGAYRALPTLITQGQKPAEQQFEQTSQALTYAPRTEAGQEYTGNVGDVLQQSGVQGLMGMPIRGATPPKLKTNLSKAQNITRDTILNKAREEGFSVLPSQVGAGAVPRALEIMSGKYKAEELVGYKNTQAASNAARRYLGLPEDAPLNEATFNSLRENYSVPYAKASKIEPTQMPTSTSGLIGSKLSRSGADIVNDLKIAREDANASLKALENPNLPNRTEIRNESIVLNKKVKQLENELDTLAKATKNPELLKELKEARKNIAKTYSVENATNTELGLVDPKKIGKELSKGIPLTDELKTVGEFANAFPEASKFITKNPNPTTIYDLAFASGGSLASPYLAAAPLARIAGRYGILTEPFQRKFVNPKYGKQQIPRIGQADLTPITGLLSYQDNNQ